MQNLVNDSTAKKNFDFVDSIRAIAMMSIVYEHSCLFWGQKYPLLADTFLQTLFVVTGKFGTVIFFLISGFLMNYKFAEYNTATYIKNRFKSTFGPWLFWIFILLAVMLIHKLVVYLKFRETDFHNVPEFAAFLLGQIGHIVFFTNYWFILNFLICICIILSFKRYIYSYYLGGFLLLLSLFYSVNLYQHWITTEHTAALFGFVFYLWAGIMLNKHFAKVSAWIKQMNWLLVISLTLLTLALNCLESVWLIKSGSDDPFNTLKISNIVFSFAVFILLLKIGTMPAVNKLKPRETTYGIYLIHFIILLYGLPLIFSPMHLGYEAILKMSTIAIAAFSVLRFIIAYAITYAITRLLAKSKLKWVIGR